MKYVYISYVVAIKRAGNIFVSVVIGKVFYNETITPMTALAAGCMILGVICIVFS